MPHLRPKIALSPSLLGQEICPQGELSAHDWLKNNFIPHIDCVSIHNPIDESWDSVIFETEVPRGLPSFLPIIQEGELKDREKCESYLIRLYAVTRLQRMEPRISLLQKYQQEYKLLIMGYSPAAYRKLGQLASGAPTSGDPSAVIEAYKNLLSATLITPPSRGRWINSLQHMAGYFKEQATGAQKRQFEDLLENFRQGITPLSTPLEWLHHRAQHHQIAYLLNQTLFEPFPKVIQLP